MLHGMLYSKLRHIPSIAGILVASIGMLGCGQPTKSASVISEKPVESREKVSRAAPPDEMIPHAYNRLEEGPQLSKVVIRDKREWDLPETAARSLGRIGAAAVPELTKQLNDRDPEVRERAADVLARIGPAAKQAVPDLVAALEDSDEAVRKSAALALGQIGPAAADAVPALMRVMKESVAKSPPDGNPQR